MQETNCNRKDFGDCMSLEGFSRCVKMDIQKRLGDSFIVSIGDFVKNNTVKLKGMVIKEQGNCLCPTIYLDDFYHQYRQGRCLTGIENEILETYEKSRVDEKVDTSFFTDWQKVKGKIVYKLINYEKNRELLKDVPHCRLLDLAIVFRCILKKNEKGIAGFLIHYSHLECWGKRQEELYQTALHNTPELMGYKYEKLDNFLGMDGYESTAAYILTNRCMLDGAGCILYKDVLKDIAENWKSDLCIIPCSVNEVILMPLEKIPDEEKMCEQIRIVNATTLRPEEILSDHMYKYIRATGKITM